MKLYLITHAHTQQNPHADATGWQLSAQGQAQAEILAHQPFWAEVQRIVVSSEAKTHLTVAPRLREHPLPLAVDARFDELRRPGWTENYVAAVAQAFAGPDGAAGGWEPAAAAQQRFLAGIDALCRSSSDETVALVGHGLTLSLYRAYLLRQAQVVLADWRGLSFAAVALVEPKARQLLIDFQAVAGEQARA